MSWCTLIFRTRENVCVFHSRLVETKIWGAKMEEKPEPLKRFVDSIGMFVKMRLVDFIFISLM